MQRASRADPLPAKRVPVGAGKSAPSGRRLGVRSLQRGALGPNELVVVQVSHRVRWLIDRRPPAAQLRARGLDVAIDRCGAMPTNGAGSSLRANVGSFTTSERAGDALHAGSPLRAQG